MQSVIQRVREAQLHIVADGEAEITESNAHQASKKLISPGIPFSTIGQGILALVAIEKGDTKDNADKLLTTLLNYRIFADELQRMNRSLLDIEGDLMLVSQFTVAADTSKGSKPSFSAAAPPDEAEFLFDYLVSRADDLRQDSSFGLAQGKFAANMRISLVNDGPVTFIIKR